MTSPTEALSSLSLQELADRLAIVLPEGLGDAAALEIRGVNTIDQAGPNELTFLSNESYAVRLKDSRAGAVLVAEDYEGEAPMPMVRAKNPRLAFAHILELFHPPAPRTPGIHPTAIIPDSCTVGAEVAIGAYVVLGEDVHLGDRVTIHPHVVVYDDVRIGEDCVLHSHVSIREGTRLGRNVILQNGAMIGPDGFGFEPDERGHLRRIPQVGTVVIGDDVDIQSNTCVDRAALGTTRIGNGVKIDNLAQIAHGCVVGDHSVICGQVGLAGSTIVGKHVMLGGQAGSRGHITIGDGVQVAAKSGIVFDLPAGGSYGGVPATELSKALRSAIFINELPSFNRSIKKLERAMAKLQARFPEEE
jgi:UDP-3-O-[3-hydroxymyristoyl] glucosamine N-acyltransferase